MTDESATVGQGPPHPIADAELERHGYQTGIASAGTASAATATATAATATATSTATGVYDADAAVAVATAEYDDVVHDNNGSNDDEIVVATVEDLVLIQQVKATMMDPTTTATSSLTPMPTNDSTTAGTNGTGTTTTTTTGTTTTTSSSSSSGGRNMTTPISVHHDAKVGGLFCACCCDYRRAAMIANILALVYTIFTSLSHSASIDKSGSQIVDHVVQDEVRLLEYRFYNIRSIGSCGGAMVSFISFIGTIYYSFTPVALCCVTMTIGFVVVSLLSLQPYENLEEFYEENDLTEQLLPVDVIRQITSSSLVLLGWLYPHIMYLKEVRAGIISKENSHREDYCACQ